MIDDGVLMKFIEFCVVLGVLYVGPECNMSVVGLSEVVVDSCLSCGVDGDGVLVILCALVLYPMECVCNGVSVVTVVPCLSIS